MKTSDRYTGPRWEPREHPGGMITKPRSIEQIGPGGGAWRHDILCSGCGRVVGLWMAHYPDGTLDVLITLMSEGAGFVERAMKNAMRACGPGGCELVGDPPVACSDECEVAILVKAGYSPGDAHALAGLEKTDAQTNAELIEENERLRQLLRGLTE